ncbi:UNVERIFIED_CONTAM: hypothetical protein PYX00_005478 [Menopon gallinae]|uniref:RING-CH-type domain-containing protein n=1 Tax=Menopon gallinae TaxID=328185 RepID=A0AAW2HRH5_9NEOP
MERSNESESGSQLPSITGLTGRLVDFAPNATEQLTEEQQSALKRATVFFLKQLMLQQNKTTNQLGNSSSDICRICRGARSKEDLLTTCGCKGTMGFIHLSCLEHWLAVSDSTKCELCSFQYETVRTPKYSVLKSIVLWLQSPGCRRDAREIMLDFLALIVFTPMAFFGTYMALLAAETCCWLQCISFLLLWTDRLLMMSGIVLLPARRFEKKLLFLIMLLANCFAYKSVFSTWKWYNTEETVLVSPTMTKIVSLGCLGVIGGIDTAYLSWLLLRVQHHAKAWHRWRRRNSIVKVILPPQKSNQRMKLDINDQFSNGSTSN